MQIPPYNLKDLEVMGDNTEFPAYSQPTVFSAKAHICDVSGTEPGSHSMCIMVTLEEFEFCYAVSLLAILQQPELAAT